jgi:hypothetical protein
VFSPAELQEAGLDEFENFLHEIWIHLELKDTKGNPSPPTPTQREIAQYLQYGPRRRMIQAFRGVGKSWITVAYVVWRILLNPEIKVMVVSAGEDLANEFSTFAMQLIGDVPWLNGLGFGKRTSLRAWDAKGIKPDKSPTVKSVGIKGQLTGSRADLIIVDDVEIPRNSASHVMRELLANLVKEFSSVLKPDGEIIYLGTPQVEQTLYNRLPDRGYEIKIWPSEVPEYPSRYTSEKVMADGSVVRKILGESCQRLIDEGAPSGTPTDPKRFDWADLAERLIEYGSAGYALQFMLDTHPSSVDKHQLRLRDLIIDTLDMQRTFIDTVWSNARDHVINDLEAYGFDGDFYHTPAWRSKEVAPYTETVMFIDPSGLGQDETAYAIVKILYSQLYLVDVGGFRDGYAVATLESLAARAAKFNVNRVITERNYGGGMFDSLFKPYLQRVCNARMDPEDSVWASGAKEDRILNIMVPLVHAHQLTVDRRVIEEDAVQYLNDQRYSFVWQFTRMAREKDCLPNEDRLEAVAGACQYFVERLSRDKGKLVAKHRNKLLDDELRKFKKNAIRPGNIAPAKARHIRGGRR